MNILCSIVGHKPPVYARKGWYSPGEQYGKVVGWYEDGCGRIHASVHAKCARCGQMFVVARIHLPREQEKPSPLSNSQVVSDV